MSEPHVVALAAFTSPPSGPAGYRWIWFDASLDQPLLEEAYSLICRRLPEDVSSIDTDRLHAGVLLLRGGSIAVFYRFLNGGRDALGRDGRFFLIAGFVPAVEASKVDTEKLLNMPAFCTVHDLKPSRTIVTFPCLSSASSLSPADMQRLKEQGRISMSGSGCMDCISGLLSPGQRFSRFAAYINGSASFSSAEIEAETGKEEPRLDIPANIATHNEPVVKSSQHPTVRKGRPIIGFIVGFAAGFITCLVIVSLLAVAYFILQPPPPHESTIEKTKKENAKTTEEAPLPDPSPRVNLKTEVMPKLIDESRPASAPLPDNSGSDPEMGAEETR